MKFWPLILGMILLAGSGCVHYRPHPLSPEKSAALLESRRLDDAGLKQFISTNSHPTPDIWPLKQWNLNSLTLAAFYFHPSLEVARAQWLVTAAGTKTAGTRPNPSVSLTPGYDSQIPGNYSPWLVPVTFDVPIETAGKRSKRIAEAEKMSESARWDFVSAVWQIRSGVRSALLDFNTATRRMDLLQKQFNAQQQMVRLQQGSFDAGEISRPELTTAQIALNKIQMDLGDARSKKSEARSRLAESIGLSTAALDDVALDFHLPAADLDTLTSAEARRVALRSRADVLAALADYAAAEADLRLEIAKQYPDLHFGPGYAWNNGNAGDNQWSLGLTLELPILDQNQGPIAEAAARRKLSAAKFVELQSKVIGEIDRAVAGWQSAQVQMKTSGELLMAAERQHQSVASQVTAGAATKMDQAAAEIEFTSTQLAQLDSEAQAQTALGALEDALQSPADDLAAVIANISTTPNAKASHP
ncbi:MAG TPA: TolC family protein [Verrucomicrobiae bacterium]|nr:TolC family protein [Verrucomicrobiae bacterium]